jgi:hypothetical protein
MERDNMDLWRKSIETYIGTFLRGQASPLTLNGQLFPTNLQVSTLQPILIS